MRKVLFVVILLFSNFCHSEINYYTVTKEYYIQKWGVYVGDYSTPQNACLAQQNYLNTSGVSGAPFTGVSTYSTLNFNNWCSIYNNQGRPYDDYVIAINYLCPFGGNTDMNFCNTPPACPVNTKRNFNTGACEPTNNIVPLKNDGKCDPCSEKNSSKSPALTPVNTTLVVGNPINAGTGNKYQVESDYNGTGAFPLNFERVYNSEGSVLSVAFNANSGWRHSYERSLLINGSTLTAYRADGSGYIFNQSGNNWIPDTDVELQLAQNTNGFVLIDTDNNIETYNSSGTLISITSRNGEIQTLKYTNGLLSSVIHSNGRKLTFTYDGYKRLSTFTDPAGGVFKYAYDVNKNLISVTYPDNSIKTYVYNEPANVATSLPHALTGIIDENGSRFATYKYDAIGRGVSSQHAGGADLVSIQYGANGTSITDALNTTRTSTTQVVMGVVKKGGTSQPAGAGSAAGSDAITYDANGNIASYTDFNGNVSCFNYDQTRNLEVARLEGLSPNSSCPSNLSSYIVPANSSQRLTTYTWNANFRLPTQITNANQAVTFSYDGNGNVLQKNITDINTNQNRTWTYTYNNIGQVLTVNGPRTDVNDITTYLYYSDTTSTHKPGDLKSITNAAGHVTTYNSYDSNGRLLSLTDPNGLVFTFNYDQRGRLIQKTIGSNAAVYNYDLAGNLIKLTKPTGVFNIFTYDAAHRLTDITDGLGGRIHYTLDGLGNHTQEVVYSASGTIVKKQTKVFDALSRLAKDIGAYNQTTQYQYDANGNAISITDANGNATTNIYDTLNRIIQSNDALAEQTDFFYDSFDNVIKVTDAANHSTIYNYNALGDLLQQTSPNTGSTQYSYDSAGNLAQKTDAKNNTGTYTFDALNRLTSVNFPNNDADVVNVYDAGSNQLGRLTSTTRGANATTYSYDLRGNVISTSAQSLPYGGNSISYTYNADNQVTDMAFGNNRDVQYQYNAVGNVNQIAVHDVDNGVFSTNGYNVTRILASNISYMPFGPVNSLTYGNGLNMTKTYDQDYRLVNQSVGTIQNLAYSYDSIGNLLSITDNINSSGSQSQSYAYTYDPADRLLSASGQNNFTYTYDSVGNRTSDVKNNNATQYNYDLSSQRLLSQSGAQADTIVTDDNGNITLAKGKTFNYSSDQRLASVQSGSNTLATYQYDSFGQRVSKTLPTGTQYFDYDLNGRLLNESAASGNYIYLDGQPLARVDYNLSDTSGNVNNWNIVYYNNNQVGAPLQTTDINGNVSWTAQIDPFGRVMPINPNITQNIRFPGQYYDQETNLFYNINRYYNQDGGRYLQSDRIGLSGGINTYAYANGNPVNRIDPLGLDSVLIFQTEPNYYTANQSPESWNLAASYAGGLALQTCVECKSSDIHVLPVNSVDQVNRALSSFQDIAQIYFIGHSNPSGLYIGAQNLPGTNISSNSGPNSVSPSRLNWSNLKQNATINIWGCNAGKGQNSIAQQLANISGAQTIAPNTYLNFNGTTGAPYMKWWRSGSWNSFSPNQ